jgi:predicted phosphoadenosine phosphosulfate sulfurtransferase
MEKDKQNKFKNQHTEKWSTKEQKSLTIKVSEFLSNAHSDSKSKFFYRHKMTLEFFLEGLQYWTKTHFLGFQHCVLFPHPFPT